MQDLSQNLCFLLWELQVPQSNWVAVLSGWAGCSEARAQKLLRGARLSSSELQAIALATNRSDQELIFSDLLAESGKDIWQQNVLFLIKNHLKHGDQQKLAALLKITSGAISDWKNGAIPERKHKKALHKFFSVPPSKNLEEFPLFLSLSPIDLNSQKAWLCDRIKNISDRELDRLFPALAKLLAEE